MVYINRQEKVKGKLETATSVGGFVWPSLQEVAPFVIPSTHPFLKRFIYVSPDIIMKVCFVSWLSLLKKYLFGILITGF